MDEALRLYPPGASTLREARGGIELGGYAVPDGTTVVVATYSIQRDAAYWPKAGEFLPERWVKVRPPDLLAGTVRAGRARRRLGCIRKGNPPPPR